MKQSVFSFCKNNPLLLICFFCILIYLPFSNKPFFMDSPITVYVAKQMCINFLNPPIGEYGKLLAPWNHTELPSSSVFYITPHPPLIPAYLSFFVRFFGENELILNWAIFPFIYYLLYFFTNLHI